MIAKNESIVETWGESLSSSASITNNKSRSNNNESLPPTRPVVDDDDEEKYLAHDHLFFRANHVWVEEFSAVSGDLTYRIYPHSQKKYKEVRTLLPKLS